LPPLLREDYIAHLFIYHKYKPYEIFPEDQYPLLDQINLQVVKFMDSDYMEFTKLFSKSDEEKLVEIENITDPVMRSLVEERLEVMDKYVKKNSPKYGYNKKYEEHYKQVGHEYYISTISKIRRSINEAIL
jgi:hypothetical protein